MVDMNENSLSAQTVQKLQLVTLTLYYKYFLTGLYFFISLSLIVHSFAYLTSHMAS